MERTLVQAFGKLIAYGSHLVRSLPEIDEAPEEVRARVENLVEEGERRAKAMGFREEDTRLALFALAAWLDEILMNAPWPGRDAWARGLLQTKYFETTKAGEEFYSYLKALRPDQDPVREVFALALAMGFRGRYCNPGDEKVVREILGSESSLLLGPEAAAALQGRELFPEAYPKDEEGPSLGRGARRLEPFQIALAAAPPVLFLLLFIIYAFVLKGLSVDVLGPILGTGG